MQGSCLFNMPFTVSQSVWWLCNYPAAPGFPRPVLSFWLLPCTLLVLITVVTVVGLVPIAALRSGLLVAAGVPRPSSSFCCRLAATTVAAGGALYLLLSVLVAMAPLDELIDLVYLLWIFQDGSCVLYCSMLCVPIFVFVVCYDIVAALIFFFSEIMKISLLVASTCLLGYRCGLNCC